MRSSFHFFDCCLLAIIYFLLTAGMDNENCCYGFTPLGLSSFPAAQASVQGGSLRSRPAAQLLQNQNTKTVETNNRQRKQTSRTATTSIGRGGGGQHLQMVRGSGENEEAVQGTEQSSDLSFILGFGALSLGLTTALAKFGLLPGPFLANTGSAETISYYTDAFILQDVGATLLTAILGYAFAKAITAAFAAGYLSSKDSRKLIHTFSAPLFILFWPIFSPAQGSQVFCALVPLLNAVRLYLASTGQGEKSLAMAVSRSGDLKEAFGGPFIYVCVLGITILSFWRNSVAGIVALCTMAVGDGLADLIGRRFGKSNPWPGLDKSVSGSTAFWIGSTLAMVGMFQWMQYWNYFPTINITTSDLWMRSAVIGLATAALELVPIGDDNYTVPLAGALMALFLFPSF